MSGNGDKKIVPKKRPGLSRRDLLKGAGGTSAALLLSPPSRIAAQNAATSGTANSILHLPVLSQPDIVVVQTGDLDGSSVDLSRSDTTWTGSGNATGTLIHFVPGEHQSSIFLESPATPIRRVHLRWQCRFSSAVRVLGDAWERSYGDLQWMPLQAERALPWYALLHLQQRTAGVGVKTGTASFAFWQVDPSGISLWLDVRNGSNGVRLGNRKLEMATIVEYSGDAGETAFATAKALCRRMAEGTSVPVTRGNSPVGVIFGSNDWYYAYGKNTPDGILRDADLVASVAPARGPKPFTVIDDGYQDRSRFPDMSKLAAGIRGRGVLPGIWIRPLRAAATTPGNLLLPNARWKGDGSEPPPLAYDPTIPESLQAIAAVATEACGWGYDLIKHDFTTFELLGQWGSQMGASPARGNWHFDDRSLTNAEVVTLLYRRIRSSCGEDRIILGCNTVGHLSVGLFDASRTGDDVSGKQWERTRRTGVNTLAFRLPQHRTFFSVDADCVPLTRDIPWPMTHQWLQAVANSGTVLLVSPEPDAVGKEQRDALRNALQRCLQTPQSEPLDWLDSRTPAEWRSATETQTYNWIMTEGEDPFPIGIQRGVD
jgi:alpha-galactosidase